MACTHVWSWTRSIVYLSLLKLESVILFLFSHSQLTSPQPPEQDRTGTSFWTANLIRSDSILTTITMSSKELLAEYAKLAAKLEHVNSPTSAKNRLRVFLLLAPWTNLPQNHHLHLAHPSFYALAEIIDQRNVTGDERRRHCTAHRQDQSGRA